MKLIIKVIVCFVVVALLTLAVLMYLEQKDGLNTSPTSIWEDIKAVFSTVGDSVDGALESTGIKDGAADLLEEGAAALKGSAPGPTETPGVAEE